jgi:hypothetical protein
MPNLPGPAIRGTKSQLTKATTTYAVASEISARGFLVALTFGNAPKADILASSVDQRQVFTVQVKGNAAGGARGFWLLGAHQPDAAPHHFYVFVDLGPAGTRPAFWVAPSKVVRAEAYVDRGKNGTWATFEWDTNPTWAERWDILG